MSKPDQSVPKVMAVVIHRPLDLTGVSLPLRHLLQCVLYPIGYSSGIVLSGLQGRQRWRGLGRGGHWDQYLGIGRLRSRTRMECRIWLD